MKIKQIIESAGGTTSGVIASVASPIGVPQKRAGSLFKGKKTKKKFYEGKMKDLAYDIQHLDAGNFMKKYGQPKDYFTKKSNKPSVNETELSEQDLIIVPGMRKSKDTSFIPHEQDRRDHEVDMARSDLYAAAKDAMRIYKMIQNRSEDEGLMGWQQSYITLASDYLNSVADSLVHETTKQEGIKGGLAGAAVGAAVTKTPKGMATGYKLGSLAQDTIADMKEGAGVIAGGMSNFEEGKIAKALAVGAMSLASMGAKAHTDTTKSVAQLAAERPALTQRLKDIGATGQVPASDKRAAELQRKQDQEMPASERRAKELKKKEVELEEGRYYNPLDQERREQDAMDQERRDFKRREMEYELRGEEEAERKANEGPWYVRIDGKLVRDKNKDPYVFNTLEAARKAAQTMMKKDWNKGKQFSMTRSTTEGMSAAVKLQRAFKDAQQQSAASRKRGQEELENARKEYDKKQADEKNKKDVTEEK